MRIVVVNRHGLWPSGIEKTYPTIVLRRDVWDDYGYQTTFQASFLSDERTELRLGEVKIGLFAGSVQRDGRSRPLKIREILPQELPDGLDTRFFSLGQTVDYYKALSSLPAGVLTDFGRSMRDSILTSLSRERLEQEEVFRVSLLREPRARQTLDRAPALFGSVERNVDAFVFETNLPGAAGPHRIRLDFSPDRGLPHRTNVLVGVNGVGKTQLMARLAILLSTFEEEPSQIAAGPRTTFEAAGTLSPLPSLYGVIAVSFSAFDDFERPKPRDTERFKYAYCGLRDEAGAVGGTDRLADRILQAVRRMDVDRRDLVRAALSTIMRTPGDLPGNAEGSLAFYRGLSAGQRIVANIVCDLILHIRPRSILLLDEPETHLHPQLLSTLTSIIGDLLEGFDSVALIATHSPIVVQQIPSKRVHVIRRMADDVPRVSSPTIETFGENLSELVRSVFEAVESDRDYEDVIDDLLAANGGDAVAVEALFEHRLGQNALVYLRSRARSLARGTRGAGTGPDDEG